MVSSISGSIRRPSSPVFTEAIHSKYRMSGKSSFIEHPNAGENQDNNQTIKPTIKRYIILFLFCLNSGNKAFQWIQIPAGTKKITYYYDVDNFVINATSVVFLVSFIVMSWPACFLIERTGLRKAVLLGSFGTAVGSIIKCYSCTEDGIVLLFVAQVIVSLSEQLIFSVPSRLASVWFPDHQVSSAMGMSVLGNQLGVALGFVVPQWILNKAETRDEIGLGLYWMFLGTAIISVLAFIADFLLFDEAPKHAPGAARLKQIEEEQLTGRGNRSLSGDFEMLCRHLSHLLTDKQLIILALSYGINNGITNTLATVLNQMLEPLWPGDDILVGNTGFCIIIFGALGSAFWGKLLDKSHKYLFINIFLNVAIIVSIALFGYAISATRSQLAVYLTATLLGIFQIGSVVAGMELAVELTYPAPELVTASIMNVTPQIFGSFFIFIASYIVDTHGAVATNLFYLLCLFVSLALSFCITETLKRQDAAREEIAVAKGHNK